MEEGDGLDVRVRQADFLVLPDQPLRLLGITRRAGDDPPELGMALLAVALRDVAVFLHVLPEARAIDRAVGLAGCRQRPAKKHRRRWRSRWRACVLSGGAGVS